MAQWSQKRGHIRHYDMTARSYDTLYGEEQRLKIAAALDHMQTQDCPAIVDLGCGTGLLLRELRQSAEVLVGLDFSRGMLKEAKRDLGFSPEIHLIRADVDHVPLQDERFNLAFAITLLQNMPRPRQTLQEIMRVTKPDAQLVVTGLKKYFARRDFLGLLREAGLQTRLLGTQDKVKCYIAACKKRESMIPRRSGARF